VEFLVLIRSNHRTAQQAVWEVVRRLRRYAHIAAQCIYLTKSSQQDFRTFHSILVAWRLMCALPCANVRYAVLVLA